MRIELILEVRGDLKEKVISQNSDTEMNKWISKWWQRYGLKHHPFRVYYEMHTKAIEVYRQEKK